MSTFWKQGVLVLLLTLTLSACNTSTPAPSTTKPTTTETKKTETANANMNKAVVDEFAIGTRVASKWADGNFYAGTIEGVNGTTYKIAYDDGDKGDNTKADLMVLPAKPTLKAGDKVLAVWSGARMYAGVVEEVKTVSAVVKWDDGSSPSEVNFGKIVLVPAGMVLPTEVKIETAPVNANLNTATAPTTTTMSDIVAGSRVASKWSDGNYWAATVKKVNGATYDLLYDDGTNQSNTLENLLLLSDKITLKKGDKVMAVWSSSGKFYDGTVQEVKTGSAMVKWDDGSTPTEVVFGKILKK